MSRHGRARPTVGRGLSIKQLSRGRAFAVFGRRFAFPGRALAATFIALLLVYNVVDYVGFIVRKPKYTDFYLYYLAAKIGLAQGWAQMYHWSVFMPALFASSHRWNPYLNPPPLAWLVSPLTVVPYWLALAVWSGLLIAAFLLTWRLAAPGSGRTRLAYLVAAIALFPVFLGYRQGQIVPVVVAAVAASWWLVRHQRPLLAGIVLSAIVLKPQVAFLVPLSLWLAGYRRVVLGFVLVAVPVGLLSLLALGTAGVTYYREAVAGTLAFPDLLQSSVIGILGSGPLSQVVSFGGAALALLTAIRARRRGPELPIAAGLSGSLLLSPYLNAYDLTGLVLAAWLVLRLQPPTWLRTLLLAGYISFAFEYAFAPHLEPLFLAMQCAFAFALFGLAARRRPMFLPTLSDLGPRAKRVVVLPAYRAAKTLREVVAQIPKDEVDRILLVDDASADHTAELALQLGIDVIKHPRNLGYGGNQKTCYVNALLMGAEVVVMLHPDGQYDPSLVPALCRAVEEGKGDIVLGSRWLGLDPAAAGMPPWKRMGNRFLTWTENQVLGLRLSEYHTGYRAYSRRFLETVPYAENSNDFVFDSQILVQAASFGFQVAEIPAVGRYFADASSIGFRTSTVYGLKTLASLLRFTLHHVGVPCRWLTPRPPAPAGFAEQAAA